jgi:putative pyruvate formate lyase activating enzyme
MGRAVSPDEFAEICMVLEEKGAENINIVTGSHAVPALARGIDAARRRGLVVPVLWNSSAYERAGMLSLLKDRVAVYLPDLKTLDRELSARFFNAPDYPEQATAAILKMMEFRELRFALAGGRNPSGNKEINGSQNGVEGENRPAVLVSGVIIRHLVLPGRLESTRAALRWFADHGQGRALFSLMTQYIPMRGENTSSGKKAIKPGSPQRFVTKKEYELLLNWLEEFDIEDGYCQELVVERDWIPDFDKPNPFSSAISTPVWHWKGGMIQNTSVF